jgi:hypothetical protein
MPDEIWSREEEFWTGGLPVFQRHMDNSCLMVLPGAGILTAPAVRDSLADTPRWTDVAITARQSIERDGLVILAYKAVAQRPGQSEYRALCGSVYSHRDGGWHLMFHQQTPLE